MEPCLFWQATMLFVELQYTLATEEAERIGVDHVARMSTSDTGEGSSGTLNLCTVNVKQRGLLENLGHIYFLFQMQCVPVIVPEVYLYQIL